MAAHEKALWIDSLSNLWSDNTQSAGTAAANATCAVSVAPTAGKYERLHMTMLGWSVRNNQAAAVTMTLNVAHASGTTAPTVIASWDITPASASSLQDTWVVNLMGKKGQSLQAMFATPFGSVVQKVSIAGWRDTLSDG